MSEIRDNIDKWQSFSEWIQCICIVTFDLELGQIMETVYPQHVQLTEQEIMNICYLAFPDSNSGCMGDTKFHVCLRSAPANLKPYHLEFNSECLPALKADPGHYFGFVYFRQVKDSTSKRGYFQKSVVVLSRLPFINLFYEVTSLIAPIYFEIGNACLESACDNIAKWPKLEAGKTLNLQLLGTIYQTFIPKSFNCKSTALSVYSTTVSRETSSSGSTTSENNNENNNNNENCNSNSYDSNLNNDDETEDSLDNESKEIMQVESSKKDSDALGSSVTQRNSQLPCVLSSIHEIDIFNSLYSVVSHIHLLWELILTSEPIVVMASSPTDCSHMVQSLISLIAPLQYCSESRPYFTIHDSEFKEFTQSSQGPVSCILGVTNPYFSKTLQHWPHTIRLTESLNIKHNNDNNHSAMGSFHAKKLTKVKSINKLLNVSSGVCTQYKPYLQKDSAIVKKIYAGVKSKRPSVVQSAILKRYFLELTQSFMIPLERYMASLMPLQKDISPFKAPPNPNQFKQDDFLATIEQSGPQLTSPCKGDFEGLYKRFFRSSNFKGWYEQRYLELQQTLQSLQLQALSQADLNKWVQGKQEVEIVDMILRIKQKLQIPATSNSTLSNPNPNQSSVQCGIKKEVRDQLLRQLEDIKNTLPDDLKIILS